MLDRLKEFNSEKGLFNSTDKLLIAVSGGVDSIVLVELLRQMDNQIAVAHCNFKLRARESDLDQEFVKEYCEKHDIPFYTISFNTKEIAAERKISTQMAARELRYDWFEDLLERYELDKLVTAHHINDQVETFFVNLLRGSGVKGLSGIPIKAERLIRPLSFATKQEVKDFAASKNLKYREDESNSENKYVRNKIRLEIIPLLEELNPSFIQNAHKSMNLLSEANLLVAEEVSRFKKLGVKSEADVVTINWELLKKSIAPQLVAYELLKAFGFNSSQVENIVQTKILVTGAIIESETNVLLVNRDELIVSPKKETNGVQEEKIGGLVFENKWLKGDVIPRAELLAFPDGITEAAFDADLIEKPILLDGWQKGDAFQPFGMKTFKKLSDFFIDEKLTLFQKEKVQVLRSNDSIVWVVGHRADNRFRITENTKQVWLVKRK